MLSISGLRKYLSVIVLMFFLFNVVGYYLWFSYVKNNIQNEVSREIKQGLPDKDLTLITIPVDDETGIRWIKPGKEFTWRGEMFDVVKIEISNNRKYLYCVNDIKEKKLMDEFSRINSSSQKAKKLLANCHYIYVIQPESFSNIIETSNYDYCIKSFDTASTVKEVTIPPPKFIFQA